MKRAALAGGLLLAAGCREIPAALDPASSEAGRIANLYWLMFWICGGVTAVVLIALFLATARAREAPTAESDRRRVRIVGTGAAIAAVLLLVLLVESVLAGREVVTPGGPQALEIQITGRQWWWEIHYPGTLPSDDVVTANEIHVPVGRPVRFELSSGDVIHSFWAPNFNGKKDLIPGRRTRHIFRADRPGIFLGRCAEFCGYQHAHMGFVIVAEEPQRFEAWLARQRQPAADVSDPARRHGREVFLSSQCVLCHTIRGTGAFGRRGPDLTHVGSRTTIAAATLPNTPGNVAGWVVDAARLKPGTRMPPNTLEPGDLLDLVAYLGSLR